MTENKISATLVGKMIIALLVCIGLTVILYSIAVEADKNLIANGNEQMAYQTDLITIVIIIAVTLATISFIASIQWRRKAVRQ